MRIISGKYKGRRLQPPANLKLRPTTDMAKEALFNILNNLIVYEESDALDLFAGIANISLELASRGIQSVVAVEKQYKNIAFIKSACEQLKTDVITVVKADVFKYIDKTTRKFDFVFADPPYDLKNIPEIYNLVFQNKLLKKNGLFVLEHPANYDFSEYKYFVEKRNYSRVNFSLFKYSESSADEE